MTIQKTIKFKKNICPICMGAGIINKLDVTVKEA
jgi:hypothetical protein